MLSSASAEVAAATAADVAVSASSASSESGGAAVAVAAASPARARAPARGPSSARSSSHAHAASAHVTSSALASAAAQAAAAAAPARPDPPHEKTTCQRLSEALLTAIYALVFIMIVVMSWQLATADASNRPYQVWCVAAFFVGLTVPLSLHDINMHLLYFVSPMQRFYVRIILLVPIYSIESWFSLRYDGASIYISTIKDLYEPFVIHSLLALMLEFLGNREALAAKLIAKHGPFANISMFPYGINALRRFTCRPPNQGGWFPFFFWRNGETFIYRTQVGVYQYIVIKVILTIGFFIATLTGTLDYGGSNTRDYYVYYSWILLISQVWAICCLVLFFEATLTFIWPMAPFMKFVAVKGMVFVSWAQGELIGYLQSEGYITSYHEYTVQDIADGLQNFIICLEMLGLAVMHHYAFNVSDFYKPGDGALGSLADGDKEGEPIVALPRMTGMQIALSVLPAHDLTSEAFYHAGKVTMRKSASGTASGMASDAAAGAAKGPAGAGSVDEGDARKDGDSDGAGSAKDAPPASPAPSAPSSPSLPAAAAAAAPPSPPPPPPPPSATGSPPLPPPAAPPGPAAAAGADAE